VLRQIGRQRRRPNDEQIVLLDGVRAERSVQRCSVNLGAHPRLERLPMFADQADHPHRGRTYLRGERREIVERFLRRRLEDRKPFECGEPILFVSRMIHGWIGSRVSKRCYGEPTFCCERTAVRRGLFPPGAAELVFSYPRGRACIC
jgi:hypothetical protein